MKVLHLNTLLTGGGTDDQCVKVILALRSLGVDARLMGPEGREFCKQVVASKLPQIISPPEGPLKIHFMRAVAREIRHGGYDIVHAHHGRDYWPTFFSVALSLRHPKIIFTRHLAKSPRSLPSRLALLHLCDHVIAVSKFTELVMKRGFDDPNSPEPERHHRPRLLGDVSKISVIHCGIDTDLFYPKPSGNLRKEWGIGEKDFIFAVVGGYDYPRGKGQREFLKAAAQIHHRLPHGRFLIIGRGSLKEILQEDICTLGLKGKAFLTPYCRNIPDLMNTINCLVHPAIGTESFGLVLLEAFASGRPVIASALDGIPEAFHMVGKGKLVKPESIEELASAMLEIGNNPLSFSMEDRWEMHNQVAKRASLQILGKRTLELYQHILEKKQDKKN